MQRTTQYFGEKEILPNGEKPNIRNDLEFDNRGIDRIASKVFHGMDSKGKGNNLTKDDLKLWTQAIMKKKFPGVPFCEQSFERGFRFMDSNKDGVVNVEDIKEIVKAKVIKENLYNDEK